MAGCNGHQHQEAAKSQVIHIEIHHELELVQLWIQVKWRIRDGGGDDYGKVGQEARWRMRGSQRRSNSISPLQLLTHGCKSKWDCSICWLREGEAHWRWNGCNCGCLSEEVQKMSNKRNLALEARTEEAMQPSSSQPWCFKARSNNDQRVNNNIRWTTCVLPAENIGVAIESTKPYKWSWKYVLPDAHSNLCESEPSSDQVARFSAVWFYRIESPT